MSSSSLLILGAGGHAKVIIDSACQSSRFDDFFLLDDSYSVNESLPFYRHFDCIGTLDLPTLSRLRSDFVSAFVAIGDPVIREHLFSVLTNLDYELPTIVHPNAFVSSSADIEPGTFVGPQVAICSDVCIGRGSIINTSASVDHDCSLGSFVHVCPGSHLAGNVLIGHRTTIGTGSSVINNISIGSSVFVGAGAVVTRSIPDNSLAIGVPARFKPKHH